MIMLRNKVFLRAAVFLVAVFVGGMCAVSPTLALITSRYDRYAQNEIYFYDPDCTELGGDEGSGGGDSGERYEGGAEKWDGSCSAVTAQREAWLEKYVSYIRSVASSNQLPWELIPAQAFMESGGGKTEACSYNPLGLKAKKGHARCANGFAKFGSYEEAFQYYVDSIIPIKAVKGKYPNDPYSAIAYIQYGSSNPFASCDNEADLKNPASSCYGHKIGDPTPGYVKNVSSLICGIQKWAQKKGIPISSVNWKNYDPDLVGDEDGGAAPDDEGDGSEAVDYCNNGSGGGGNDDDGDYEDPKAGDLASYVKAWAWPDYHKAPYTTRMPAYAEYMDHTATYHPCSGVDCGAFVANIIKASGWDTSYPQGNSSTQRFWLSHHWEQVTDISSLKLGDVGVRTGHVILYVGNIPGFHSKTASASSCTGVHKRAPTAGSSGENLNNYTWYRKK